MSEEIEGTGEGNEHLENESSTQGENTGNEQREGHRRRRKVRRRIRIKKKSGPKKKIKKYLERILWLIIIGGFIATLIIMVKQLEIQDPNAKKKKKSHNEIKIEYFRDTEYSHINQSLLV